MKRVTRNSLQAVTSMLEQCPQDEVNIFLVDHAGFSSICVYPTSDDALAATVAVQIAIGGDPLTHAAVVGVVHLHNVRIADQTKSAVNAFFRDCLSDFYFGFKPDDEI